MTANFPDIYLFNPTCEYAVANSHSSWQPNLLLQKMEEDLGTLPLFLARPNDVILVKKAPPDHYLRHLEKAGIQAPSFQQVKQMAVDNSFLNTPKNRLLPWGWSPATHRLLNPLKPSCSAAFHASPVASWKEAYRELYSKKFALECLTKLLPLLPNDVILPPELLPRVCTCRRDLEILLERWGQLMVKAPWSSSGRGLQPVTKTPVVSKVWEKLLGIIKEQGYAMAEPFLEKILDMALQFRLINGTVHFVGVSRFNTDRKGQYQGNFLNGWPDSTAPQAAAFAANMTALLVPELIKVLQETRLAQWYEGSFGVDTLIFRDSQNNLRINPCLEINVRQNMGLLSLHLEKLLAPGTKGTFNLFFQKGKNFAAFQREMRVTYPLKIVNNRIESGFFSLTPSDDSTLFGAYLLADA